MNRKNINNKNKKNKKRKGFTLIELLAVIVVLAIVLVVTIPSIISSMNNAKEKQFENATTSVKEWFEKQYEANKIGYASEEYKKYLETNCGDENATGLTDPQKEEILKCKNLNKISSLTDAVIKAAGLDPNDIDANNSYVAFSENGKAEINLTTTKNNKFSNDVLMANSKNDEITDMPNSENLLDFTKRASTVMNSNEKISINKYYINVSRNGSFESLSDDYNVTVSENDITFKYLGSGYGILIPFLTMDDYNYVIKFKGTKSQSLIAYSYYEKDGTINSYGFLSWSKGEVKDLGNGYYEAVIPTKDDNIYYTCLQLTGNAANVGDSITLSDITVTLRKTN